MLSAAHAVARVKGFHRGCPFLGERILYPSPSFRFTPTRATMERLTARAIREGRSLESLVAELLEDEGTA